MKRYTYKVSGIHVYIYQESDMILQLDAKYKRVVHMILSGINAYIDALSALREVR